MCLARAGRDADAPKGLDVERLTPPYLVLPFLG
jgi:hypothetical protein